MNIILALRKLNQVSQVKKHNEAQKARKEQKVSLRLLLRKESK